MFTPFCWHLSYINHCYSLLIFVYLVEEKNLIFCFVGNFYILVICILYIITAVDLVIWPGLFFYETSYNNVIKCSYKVKKHTTIIKNIKKEKLTQQYSVSIQNSIKL